MLAVLAASSHPATQRHTRVDVLGSQLAAQMGPHPRAVGHWSSFVSVVERAASQSTTDARGTPPGVLVAQRSRRDDVPGELLGTDDERVPGPGAVRLFELCLERTAIW